MQVTTVIYLDVTADILDSAVLLQVCLGFDAASRLLKAHAVT